MAGYEYDVFISYSRVGATSDWLTNHLVPMLKEALEFELTRPTEIYFDRKLSAGGTWPAELGHKLGRSRILLALWSKAFLTSDWCAREVSVMRAREVSFDLRSPASPNGMIAISIIHDGETMPAELNMIQCFEIKNYFNTRMVKDGAMAEGLYEQVKRTAPDLAAMIEAAPPFQEIWPEEAAEAFFQTFYQSQAVRQTMPPRFSI